MGTGLEEASCYFSIYRFFCYFNNMLKLLLLYLLLPSLSSCHFPFSIFSTTFPCPTHPHLSPSILLPFGFVHGSFTHVHLQPFLFFPTLFAFPLPSGYCQFVLNFSVSGYILFACFFVD